MPIHLFQSLISITLLLGLGADRQDDSKFYERNNMYLLAMDQEGRNVKSIKPLGRNVLIHYKPFFKSYYIVYDGADGQSYPLNLEYLYTNSRGNKIVQSKDGLKLEVLDNLHKNGDLSLISVEPITGDDGISLKVAFRITNQNMN